MNEQHTLRRSLSLFQVIALAAGGMVAAWMVEIKYWSAASWYCRCASSTRR